MSNIEKGQMGEKLAKDYLLNKGYKLVDQNYSSKYGEIDLIFTYEDILVFVEVKTRSNISYGFPYEFVDNNKQERIIKTSMIYIQENNFDDIQLRYDIVEIYLNSSKIQHIENSFTI